MTCTVSETPARSFTVSINSTVWSAAVRWSVAGAMTSATASTERTNGTATPPPRSGMKLGWKANSPRTYTSDTTTANDSPGAWSPGATPFRKNRRGRISTSTHARTSPRGPRSRPPLGFSTHVVTVYPSRRSV